MIVLDPITSRDFSKGRIAKTAVAPYLTPQNSVANSLNVDYSEIIGSGIVRKGNNTVAQIESSLSTGQSFTNTVLTDEAAFGGANDFQALLFTPVTGQSTPRQIALKLYRVGAAIGLIELSLQTVSGGNPSGIVVNGNTITLDPSTVTTSTNGAVYFFPLTTGTFLTPSTQYAIVMKYTSGNLVTRYIEWMRNLAGSLTGASIVYTTNAGSTWSGQSGIFYFIEYIQATTNTYDRAPMGNFSCILSGLPRNVVAFRDELSTSVMIWYYNGTNWAPSDIRNFSYLSRCRFAVLNGYIYEANGAQTMRSSADYGATWSTTGCITTGSVQPSLLNVSKNRMLASGYSAYPSRIYFSSIVDPAASPSITWNTNASSGDWLDVNPDDGGIVTGFANTSTVTLVFKNNAMYRLNAITKTVDSENIFNVGAVSQEAITTCLGITYFYSGNGIYQTDGTFPQQISRLGVQDFINLIVSNYGSNLPTEVYAWNDGFNVYFSIGTIHYPRNEEGQRTTIPNVVLKFSPRDQSWQIMSYPKQLGPTSLFGTVSSSDGLS